MNLIYCEFLHRRVEALDKRTIFTYKSKLIVFELWSSVISRLMHRYLNLQLTRGHIAKLQCLEPHGVD